MILGHIGRRDEDDGLAHQREFGYGDGTCTRHYHVGSGIGKFHTADKLVHLDPFFEVCIANCRHRLVVHPFARLPYYLHIVVLEEREIAHHHKVDAAGTQTASHRQQHGTVGIHLEGSTTFGSGGTRLLNDRTNGVASINQLGGREVALHAVVSHADSGCRAGKGTVGETCV